MPSRRAKTQASSSGTRPLSAAAELRGRRSPGAVSPAPRLPHATAAATNAARDDRPERDLDPERDVRSDPVLFGRGVRQRGVRRLDTRSGCLPSRSGSLPGPGIPDVSCARRLPHTQAGREERWGRTIPLQAVAEIRNAFRNCRRASNVIGGFNAQSRSHVRAHRGLHGLLPLVVFGHTVRCVPRGLHRGHRSPPFVAARCHPGNPADDHRGLTPAGT